MGALTHGFVIMSFASAFGNESGSHVKPALVVAGLTPGEHAPLNAVPVIIAHLLGGIAGAFVLAGIYGYGAPHHLGATTIDLSRTTPLGGFRLEAVGTFFLASIVLDRAMRGKAGPLAPVAIGMTVALCIMSFGVITGGSLNPARTLGPALATGDFLQLGLYVAAQFGGAAFAGALYRFVWNDTNLDTHASAIPALPERP